MDFTQNKLSRKEWETIEVPITEAESQILSMIIKGYTDVNIKWSTFYIKNILKNMFSIC